MNTWYRILGIYTFSINAVEVEKSTESSVWIKGRRFARASQWEKFFPSWKETHEYLIENSKKRLHAAEKELEYAKEELQRMLVIQIPK